MNALRAENVYPKAGEVHKGLGTRLFALAPLPVATGYPAVPQQVDLKRATETTLDHGKGDYWGFEFGNRFSFTMVVLVFFAMLLTHIVGANLLIRRYGDFFTAFIKATPGMLPIYLACVGGTFLFMCFIAVMAFFKTAKQVPIRFNREKRQVFAVVGEEHFIADWEAISVQVETALLVGPHSVIQHCTLIFQIPDLQTGRHATLSVGYPAEALAIADWEAIRVFMEQGLTVLKEKSETPDLLTPDSLKELEANPQPTAEYYQQLMAHYEEGSVEYFYAIKNRNKYCDSKSSYYFWLFCHVMTAWTLPCHIAQWLNNKNYVKRPKALLNWSKPVPPALWAKPSDELIEQNNQLLAAYGKNGVNNIKDYFLQQPKGLS